MLSADDVDAALLMADDRNLTVHTYDEALAEAVFARIRAGHIPLLRRWVEAMMTGPA